MSWCSVAWGIAWGVAWSVAWGVARLGVGLNWWSILSLWLLVSRLLVSLLVALDTAHVPSSVALSLLGHLAEICVLDGLLDS